MTVNRYTQRLTATFLPLLFCSLMASFSLNSTAFAQENKVGRTLTVTGHGDRFVQTTKARVQLGIEVEAKTAKAVQTEIARRTSVLVSELQELKVEKLQTVNVTLSPKIVYENNRQRQVGFMGQSSVSFITDLDKAGVILDAAVGAGANRVDQIGFIAPTEAIHIARGASLQDAVKDALEQADAVLDVLNLKVQGVRTIQVNNSEPVQPMLNARAAFATADGAPPTPIIGGEHRVQTSVTLEITY